MIAIPLLREIAGRVRRRRLEATAALNARSAHLQARPAPPRCDSEVERASRDFYDSVTLERRLGEHGTPLLATDEPPDITGLSPTMILVRRIKQGVAEWFRISL